MTEKNVFGHRVVGKIIGLKGSCNAGHKVEDEFELSGHDTAGLCGFFYHDIFPYIIMLQLGEAFLLSGEIQMSLNWNVWIGSMPCRSDLPV